ncbi:efflux pump antibiotic resistance protein, putative [Talaromyces stipitatus ATCC 10500]|uniref:Efflux pump antibiotic resistance protein, putative n=1 Tax=Talaromyces stipitatus (strain ATCC 10500 / CBS 375.48 / QM 6759 / NRRL 1006) TaxID=441959 RepID=B8LTZ2_TALSN|nr:efflux pump antibiotic resistance protein, putative [Talaromyces stipitatus ATCC 10500]EED23822.1 efflux pump antibiotic resistance protein, putative [Talaromyces stipitatus ATCC 10500]
MFENFNLFHVPSLFVATAVTFGGLIPFFNAEYAIVEFGLPQRIANSKPAQSVMILSSARGTAIGIALFTFYFQGKLVEFDTVLTILGAYVGLVDGYVCLREDVPNKAVFRTASGLAIAAWGWFSMTITWRQWRSADEQKGYKPEALQGEDKRLHCVTTDSARLDGVHNPLCNKFSIIAGSLLLESEAEIMAQPYKDGGGEDTPQHTQEDVRDFHLPWRVRCVFIILCLLSFMSAIDATIVTTSLQTVTQEIGGQKQYVWIVNAFMFATTVPQPFYGQIANIFGRRHPMIVAISLFALGSGISGGATSAGMLIAGRTIQGLGAAGLYVLSDIIICDLVPPRHRGPYLSAVLSTAAIGTTIGPIIGGALAEAHWRWIFWINLPVSAVGLLEIIFLLRVKHENTSRIWRHAVSRVDILGNLIFIPSMFAIFFGLIMGGEQYPWNSWHIIIPLVLGVLGCVIFALHQASSICKEPSTPPRLFKHSTSAAGYIIIFLAAVILQAISYFLPTYFQAVKGTSPLMSGVDFLPFALAIIPFGGITGWFMSKTGLYIPIHWMGFILTATGAGLLSTLNQASSRGAWIGYQILVSGGTGMIFTATLPSTLAPLSESDVAVATGTYSFIRSFGLVWGATVASVVFNSQIDAHLGLIAATDSGNPQTIRDALAYGKAYSYASGGFITSLPDETQHQVVDVYVKALRVVWLVVTAVACLGFVCVIFEKPVELRKEHDTQYGLVEDTKYTNKEGIIVNSSIDINTVEQGLSAAKGGQE